MLQYLISEFCFAHEKLKKSQIYFFFSLLSWAAQMTQTEEFKFQNVAYRPIV